MGKILTNRDNCPIHLTSNILGDRWILLLLRELFLGQTRFDEFQKNLNISKSVLTVKLKSLVENRLVVKSDYKEANKRTRNEYHLSELGKQLIFIMGAILEWGSTNLVNQDDTYLKIVDKSGSSVQLAFLNKKNKKLPLKDLQFELS